MLKSILKEYNRGEDPLVFLYKTKLWFSNKARQQPRIHILHIKIYLFDSPNIRPFLKTRNVWIPLQWTKYSRHKLLALRWLQAIVTYRWCPKVSWSILSFLSKYVAVRSSHAFILLSSVNSHQFWELPILPILIFGSNLKWKINILMKEMCLVL